jgi:hypothetical protein
VIVRTNAENVPGHLGTLSYIYEEILKLGDYYDISNQSFPAVSGSVFESRLVLGDQVPKSAAPMGLTPPTKDKEPVHGDLVLVPIRSLATLHSSSVVSARLVPSLKTLVAKAPSLLLSTTTRKTPYQVL